jgi:hypothetical protein
MVLYGLECVAFLVGVEEVVEFFQTNIPYSFAGLHLEQWEQSSSSAFLF